jgi:hypothetical protein
MTEEEATEKIEPLPTCSGKAGEVVGVDCRKAGKPKKSLAQQSPQSLPIIDVSGLPICNGTNGTPNIDCRNPPPTNSLAQKEEDEKFEYPKSNGFDLPELPECTGMNGPDAGGRKV